MNIRTAFIKHPKISLWFIFCHSRKTAKSRDSTVGVVTKILARRPKNRGSIPGKGTVYSVPNPVSYSTASSSHDIRILAMEGLTDVFLTQDLK